MFSSFPFLRYGHQTADIKPFPKLTSARLFSQEPRKKRSSKHCLLVPVLSHMAIKPVTDFRSWRAGDMAAQNFKEEDWGNGDTKLGQNWQKNFQACCWSVKSFAKRFCTDLLNFLLGSIKNRSWTHGDC